MPSQKQSWRSAFIAFLVLLIGAGASPALAAAAPHSPTLVHSQDLQKAVDARAAARDADRAAIRTLLGRPAVREAAGRAGLDVDRALDGVNTLSDQELSALSTQARNLDSQLAGGAAVVITTTVLTLVLILIIILLVA